MENFVKEMIDEHKVLVLRINTLANNIYIDNNDDKVEFANKSIQLSAMRKYEEALRARLENRNITITETGEYFEKVDDIENVLSDQSEQDINYDKKKPESE